MEFCIICCYSLKFNLAEIEIGPLRSKHSKINREGFCIPCWDGCLVEVLNNPETTAGLLTTDGDLRSVESAPPDRRLTKPTLPSQQLSTPSVRGLPCKSRDSNRVRIT